MDRFSLRNKSLGFDLASSRSPSFLLRSISQQATRSAQRSGMIVKGCLIASSPGRLCRHGHVSGGSSSASSPGADRVLLRSSQAQLLQQRVHLGRRKDLGDWALGGRGEGQGRELDCGVERVGVEGKRKAEDGSAPRRRVGACQTKHED